MRGENARLRPDAKKGLFLGADLGQKEKKLKGVKGRSV